MSDPVPALIPLALLEAIRNLDTLPGDAIMDLDGEELTKRLGLSDTVAAQIRRYRASAESGGTIGRDEALGVFRLVGRRADHGLCFEDAGRRAARYAAGSGSPRPRSLFSTRRAAERLAARTAAATFGLTLATGDALAARATSTLALDALPGGDGCALYGAALAELLRVLTGWEGAFHHETCRGHGAPACVWTAIPSEEPA